ncbi:uncharacterized protein LOC113312362 [Papaver somniferum]|uniref:uncharacterized protein LOC113312362 n=1 Tax=Papaver somniferum TaxID=3469 RepID=UPI000E6F89D1|nr:uncharacterized protein LOC113312362 [Papaver somniferum]
MGNDNLTPIYYIRKALKEAELRYSPTENACLPLVLAAQKLRHYLLAHQTELGVKNIEVKGNSHLLIQQTLREFNVKEPSLAAYRDKAQRLIVEFDSVSLDHRGRASNKHVDALSMLASSLQMLNVAEETIMVTNNTIPSTWFEDIIFENENDWRRPILKDLKQQPEDLQLPWKTLCKYKIIDGSLYFITTGGILCRCVGTDEEKKLLHRIHERTCGFGLEIPLQRRIQRDGFYWPDMVQQAQNLQDNCGTCQGAPLHEESFMLDEEDWKAAKRLEKRARKFFVIDGELFRRSFNQKTLKCVDTANATRIMEVSHDVEHQGKARLFTQIHDAGYYWLTMETDITEYVQRIPMYIISDNGTPFVNSDVKKLLEAFRIRHKVSTPYYPQGNGQAESTNKSLLRILSRSLYDNKRVWHEELPLALMAYRIAKRTSTGFSPYSLVYGEDAIIPEELIIASSRILSASGIDLDSQRVRSLDMIDERRDIAERRSWKYRDRRVRFYNRHVKERHFENGELVLAVVSHVQREGSAGKFAPNWEEPFQYVKLGGLDTTSSNTLMAPRSKANEIPNLMESG